MIASSVAIPLEAVELTPPTAILGFVMGGLGVLSLYKGWKIYTEPIPRFVTSYRGWSSTLLTLPYSGTWLFCMGVELGRKWFHCCSCASSASSGSSAALSCSSASSSGSPASCSPPWYRRALKAGIPRHDPYAMGAFKTLPVEEQKAAAAHP